MPKTTFVRPTQEEVAIFIKKTMQDWPDVFCDYMAEKFWNAYQSRGWQINGRLMKDYTAAFHAQWKHLKYKEDKDMLEKCLNDITHKMKLARERKEKDGMFAAEYGTDAEIKPMQYYLNFFQNLYESWQRSQVGTKQLSDHFQRLERMGLMNFSQAQQDWIVRQSGNDGPYKRGLSVEVLFTNITRRKLTIKQFYDAIHQKPACQDAAERR